MSEDDRIFFSPEEAIGAIRRDFAQYPPQTRLFLELSPIILGHGTSVIEDSRNSVIWIACTKSRSDNRMRRVSPEHFGKMLCDHLENSRPPPDRLSEICTQVFRIPAQAGRDASGRTEGIWMDTQMRDFGCMQCGNCCRYLDYHDLLTEADVRLWREKERDDILEWVAVWGGNGEKATYTIWVVPGTRHYASVCPWLCETGADQGKCLIHEVKPGFCRNYPGTRKHAQMTGCSGWGESSR